MSTTIQTARPSGSGTTPPARRSFTGSLVRRLRTLKGQFMLHAGLILLLAGILLLVGATSLKRSTDDLNTINSGSIPSVDAALSITQLIEIIDAQSADYLAAADLTNTTPCTIAGLNTTSTT